MDFVRFSNKGIKHFSHKHQLIFQPEQKIDGKEVSCYGCQQPIWGPSYCCVFCVVFWHKLCAELPQKMTHPMHPQHSLTLLQYPSSGSICSCAACGRRCEIFFYHCSSCNFSLDIICLSMRDKIQHKIEDGIHKHPLISLQRPALFLCSACGTEHRGASYLCTTCGFWVNQKCASLPSTFKYGGHQHTLTLSYCLPPEYHRFRPNCDVCDENLKKPHWVYYCEGCRYFSHINCVTSKAKLSRGCETEVGVEDLQSNLIRLPLADESVDPLTLFIKDISLQGKHNKAAEITHFSHEHPLIFVNKQVSQESNTNSKFPLLNDVSCNGCAKLISAPFYHCDQCNFFLHERCVELHEELLHPCHQEHPLLLIPQQTTNFHLRQCQCCVKLCNVFMYGCSACKFYLDIECASLPHKVRHEAHKRSLRLNYTTSCKCSTCEGNISGFVYACGACKFSLCHLCALLPFKINHSFDKHPFTLTYSAMGIQLDDYCAICEEDTNPKFWIYHCAKCDQSLHTGCIHPRVVDMYSNVKFGDTLKVDDHPHLLTFARHVKNNWSGPPCNSCGKISGTHPGVFECAPCDFKVHYYCVFNSEGEERRRTV